MRRNLGGTPDEIKSMSTEEVQGFFRSLHQKKPATGPLQWQTVKAELIHTVVTKQVSSTKEQLTGEWLPLSVWVSRGWDAETVLRQKNEWSESYGCQIFQVSVRADIWEECRVRVTESILRQERAANKKNKKEDLDVPVAASSAKQDSKEGKSEAAELKRVARANDKVNSLAAKSLGPFTAALTQCEKLTDKVEANPVPEGTLKAFNDLKATLQQNTTAAREAINVFNAGKGKAPEEQTQLTQLPFDASEIKTVTQQASVILKSVRAAFPKAAPKPKAAGKRKIADSAETGEPAVPAQKRRRQKGA